ncbi:ABC transporter ATP-binding protein [Nocardioides nitrophenolicus]|uniref:ABC transporter ATP-binding protein n=1 Tax=Nocardioides nitrophenolicus TaxID=60489 RepID=UPI00195E01D1|nr:ABC transporter ATP-binding protein [Nocardioides nitrophenolicus]MBM7515875.1 iron complex transport system ATP-binding protein [Nocardioides nitrophenolicus]
MIVAEDLHFGYDERPVLRGVGLEARPGRVLGLLGPNGSGKTTALRLLYGSLRPERGRVSVGGVPLARLRPREVARRIAVVVQESDADAMLSVREMVTLGRLPRLGTFQRAGDVDRSVVDAALARVGGTHLAARPYADLSGGERQRVLVARALAQEADFLLLDEPTNHLDIRYQHEVLGLVREVATSAVVVLHDLNLAARYCDDLVLLDRGRVAAAGSPDAVLDPHLLERVYGIGVTRTDAAGHPQLLFHPLAAVPERLPA